MNARPQPLPSAFGILPSISRPAPDDSLLNLLRVQIGRMREAIEDSEDLGGGTRSDLMCLLERAEEEIAPAGSDGLELAGRIHRLAFELYTRLGENLRPAWARQWIYIDLEVEAHLRLHGFGTALEHVYRTAV